MNLFSTFLTAQPFILICLLLSSMLMSSTQAASLFGRRILRNEVRNVLRLPSAFRQQQRQLCCFQTTSRFPNTRIASANRLMGVLPTSCGSLLSSSSCTRLYSSTTPDEQKSASFFSDSILDFKALGVQSEVLLQRLAQTGLHRPTAVQAQAFAEISMGGNNVTVGAETGSGKTLAYLLPLLDDILQRKKQLKLGGDAGYDYARAVILVPNKELVQQVIRMAVPLAGGPESLIYGGNTLIDPSIVENVMSKNETDVNDGDDTLLVKMAIFPGGLKEPVDFPPFRKLRTPGRSKAPAVDLIVATPATLGPLGLSPKNIDMFADIETLVIDEADMLLDGGFIRSLEQVLMGFRRSDKLDRSMGIPKTQHVFVAATLPDYGLRSVDAFLKKRFPTSVKVTVEGMHKARHSGLAETTMWIPEESKKVRMQYLVDLLGKPVSEGGLKDEKVMVFLNSVADVEGAADALTRVGYNAIPYHAKVPLVERTATLDRFRRYNAKPQNDDAATEKEDNTVPIMVCTDLAARGLDVPNVTAIVQLQFAGNVVAHLHRMGRCGRAGNVEGRGFVFYSNHEAPLIEVVRAAEHEQQNSSLQLQGPDVDLDSELPDNDDDDNVDDGETTTAAGTVNKAFSRRRGFTRKRKQLARKEQERTSMDDANDE